MSVWEKLRLLAIMAIISLIFTLATTLTMRAQEHVPEPSPEQKAAFFLRMHNAMIRARDTAGARIRLDCCGEGDWTLVRPRGPVAGGLEVEVTDPRRHTCVSKGLRVVVPVARFVIGDNSPWRTPGLFISDDGALRPLCYLDAAGG